MANVGNMDSLVASAEGHGAKPSKRDASVDAFRCMLMFLIVLHHAAFHGYWRNDTSNWMLPLLFTTLIYWHVDSFISISGWYGVRFSVAKFFSLYGVIVFWSMVKLLVVWLVEIPVSGPRQIWSGGWFGGTYLIFMFLAPFINASIERLKSLERKRFILIWVIFNIGMMVNWTPLSYFSGITASGGDAFSILTFVYVYVNVRLIKLSQFEKVFNYKVFLASVGCFVLGVACFSLPFGLRSYLRMDMGGGKGIGSASQIIIRRMLL